MKRNILATISYESKVVRLTVIEKLATNVVEIFNSQSTHELINHFFTESLQKIEELIGGKLTVVSMVVNQSKTLDSKIELWSDKIALPGQSVVKNDVQSVLDLISQKFETGDRKVTLVQPLKFDVKGLIQKSYLRSPIYKQGSELVITAAVTTIARSAFNYINNILQTHNLSISQILLTPQAISQNNISESALRSGVSLIHISDDQSFVAISKNSSTISSMSFHGFGIDSLLEKIAKSFEITISEAKRLLLVCGTLKEINDNRIIFPQLAGKNSKLFTLLDLQTITQEFVKKLLAISDKFFKQKGVNTLPVIISGQLNSVPGLAKVATNLLGNELVSLYNPISFIEVNQLNATSLGVLKFMDRINHIMGQQYENIVETNPETVSLLRGKSKSRSKWYAKLWARSGGKYEWK